MYRILYFKNGDAFARSNFGGKYSAPSNEFQTLREATDALVDLAHLYKEYDLTISLTYARKNKQFSYDVHNFGIWKDDNCRTFYHPQKGDNV